MINKYALIFRPTRSNRLCQNRAEISFRFRLTLSIDKRNGWESLRVRSCYALRSLHVGSKTFRVCIRLLSTFRTSRPPFFIRIVNRNRPFLHSTLFRDSKRVVPSHISSERFRIAIYRKLKLRAVKKRKGGIVVLQYCFIQHLRILK